MGLLDQAKLLGGIGSILMIIPITNIVGFILVLIAVNYIAKALQERQIFNNMLYGVIAGLVGGAIGSFLLITGLFFAVFTFSFTAIAGLISFLAIIWVAFIVAAIFVMKSFNSIASKLNIGMFQTAGILFLIGAFLVIVLGVGFIVLFVAYILQTVAFFSIDESKFTQQAQQKTTQNTSL